METRTCFFCGDPGRVLLVFNGYRKGKPAFVREWFCLPHGEKIAKHLSRFLPSSVFKDRRDAHVYRSPDNPPGS
jgi:hypothetical protein